MSAPTSHDPLVVNTRDGVVWVRRAVVEGRGLYAVTDSCKCPEYLMATLTELAEHGIAGSADVLPMPVGPKPSPAAGSYSPALPWAALMDGEDLADFLDELADSATVNASSEVRLAEVERTCATWRLIAEAQHGHNTAPGPDAVTQVFAPVASLREDAPLKGRARLDASAAVAAEATHWKRLGIEDPHDSPLHQSHRVPHDLPVPDGCRLGADDLDEISRDVWFGGGA
jgi:hypothetical protein